MSELLQGGTGWILWGMLAIYMIGMLVIGFVCTKKINSLDDFIVAGRRLTFWVATATMVATQFGAGSCMGVAATVYGSGVRDVIADPISMSLCLLVAAYLIVGKLRRGGYTTVPDIIEARYGKVAGVYAGIFMLPVYIGWTGAQIIGFGTVIHLLVPQVSLVAGMLIGGGVVLLYTICGGMWAVTMTDVVQVCIMIIGLLCIVPGMFSEAGGFSAVFSQTAEDGSSLISIMPEPNCGFGGHVYYIGQWIIMGLGCMIGQELIQRSMAAKTEKIAIRSCFLSGFIYFAIGLISISVGLAAKILFQKWGVDVAAADNLENEVLPRMAMHILGGMHPILLSVFICALLAAIMSSSDSSLLATSTLFVKNVFLPIFPQVKLKSQLKLARIMTVVALLFSVWLALSVDSIYGLMVNSWSSLLVVVVMPCIGAMYFRRSGKLSALSCMISGTVVWLGFVIINSFKIEEDFPALLDTDAFDYYLTNGSVYGFFTGVIVFFLVYLLFERKNPPAPERVYVEEQPEDAPAEAK